MFSRNKKSLFLFATDSEDIDNRLVFSRELDRLLGKRGGTYLDWSFLEAVSDFF